MGPGGRDQRRWISSQKNRKQTKFSESFGDPDGDVEPKVRQVTKFGQSPVESLTEIYVLAEGERENEKVTWARPTFCVSGPRREECQRRLGGDVSQADTDTCAPVTCQRVKMVALLTWMHMKQLGI